MDWHRKSIRMGALVIAVAVVLRLWSAGTFEAAFALLGSPAVGSFLLYLETGRVVRPLPEATEPTRTDPTPGVSTPTEPEKPRFSREDGKLVRVWGSGKAVEPEDFLEMPLEMELDADAPTVLILHTHATESYTQTPDRTYQESSSYRTLDPEYNMVAVGTYLEELLEAGGIRVVHDTEFHDYPEYTGAYTRSQAAAEAVLREHPEVFLILDLHRDSLVDDQGRELDTNATVRGQRSAQLMFLMGTNHENWKDNMNLAVKLTAQLEKMYPGVTRGVMTRKNPYNQFLSPGALLVEVGAAGDTQEEAMLATQALAEAILALRNGAE